MASEKEHKNLSDIPKKDIFKTPEGYFNSLQEKIDQRIKGKPEARILGMPSQRLKFAGLAIAASVALLIIFLPARQTDPSSPSAAELISQISDEDCLAFLQNSEIEIDDLLGLSEPELWDEAIEDATPDATKNLNDDDADILYEQYGVTPDENLQML